MNKTIKIVLMALVMSCTYQFTYAQCSGNKIRMTKGWRGCGCNTCQRVCVAAADTVAYLVNGWNFGDCFKVCCASGWRSINEEVSFPETSLTEIYPNPVSGIVTIDFTLSQAGEVALQLYDIAGRHVVTIADEVFEEEGSQVTWDAVGLNQGIYFIKMNAGDYSEVKRISVMKP